MNLLSINLLLVCCALITALLLQAAARSVLRVREQAKLRRKQKPKKPRSKLTRTQRLMWRVKHTMWRYRCWPYGRLVLALGAGLAVAELSTLLLGHFFNPDELPAELWLILLPVGLAVVYLASMVRRGMGRLAISAGTLVLCTLFSGLLINEYYGYYPTVASLFGHVEAATTITLHNNAAASQAPQTVLEESYEPARDQPVGGKLVSFKLPGTTSHFAARDALVYLPPAALTKHAPKLPVVILMAGSPGRPADWFIGAKATATLDSFAAQHKGLTPIVVAVDNNGSQTNDTECVNSVRGNVETYLTQDVPTYVRSAFGVETSPQAWAIGGLSDGGMCGLMLTLAHPGLFKTFLDFGGEAGPEIGNQANTIRYLFGGSQSEWAAHTPSELLSAHRYPDIGGWFSIGDSDTGDLVGGLKTTYQQAAGAGIDATLQLVPGGRHTFYVWEQSFQNALPWLANRQGLTLCDGQCSGH